MNPRTLFFIIAIVQLVWLLAQWKRRGFLSAMNLVAYAALTTTGYVMQHWVE